MPIHYVVWSSIHCVVQSSIYIWKSCIYPCGTGTTFFDPPFLFYTQSYLLRKWWIHNHKVESWKNDNDNYDDLIYQNSETWKSETQKVETRKVDSIVNDCDPIYKNPVKHFDNINLDPLYLKNYSTNLLCFYFETILETFSFFQDKNKVNWLNSSWDIMDPSLCYQNA